MRAFVRRHRVALSAATLAVVAVGVFVAVWFQPQKLVIDKTVHDPLPTAAQPASPQGTAPPATPVALASGTFRSRAHHAEGSVRVLRLADGSRVVRLEGLSTENGPDLHLYLTEAAADVRNDNAFSARYASLGKLKGNKGDQTYQLPATVDLGRYAAVVIWCKRFSVAFGAAALT